MAHLTVLKLQQLRSTSDSNLGRIQHKIKDAREKNALERKKLDKDMTVGSRFGKSSMTGERFPTVPSMSFEASTHQSLNSLTRKNQYPELKTKPE